MAESGPQSRITKRAVSDLTATQHHIMRAAGDGGTNIASNAVAAFAVGMIGVQQYKANSGRNVTIAQSGKSKVVIGASVTQNGLMSVNASGRAINATSGDLVCGRFETAGSNDGETVTTVLFPPFRLSGAI